MIFFLSMFHKFHYLTKIDEFMLISLFIFGIIYIKLYFCLELITQYLSNIYCNILQLFRRPVLDMFLDILRR